MLKNAYFLAKIGTDTAENEKHCAEISPIGRRRGAAEGRRGPGRVQGLPERAAALHPRRGDGAPGSA